MKVAVIGLDCAEPSLIFDRWLDDLPNIARLVEGGTWGRMRSVDPPITVPAWTCMTSSRHPGDLGIYGFRNRRDHGYDGLAVADARSVTVDRVWDVLGDAGRRCIVLGVPQTYPPPEINGELVGDFLVPDTRRDQFTHPPELREEIQNLVGGQYQVDVRNFRSDDRDRILAEIYEMTEQHFTVARHLTSTRPWDFFMMVEIGLDRIHHAFWRYLDESHPRFEPGHRFADVIKTYCQYLDDEIGELLECFDDDTAVLVVSDHGARAMHGAICINEWLMQEGYLTLRSPAAKGTTIREADVDWSRTRAWGEGGYYCRLCLNVEGREPQGIVPASGYAALRDELAAKLEALPGPDGPIGTRAHRPEDLWPDRAGIPPDLLVYFGDLAWRSNGTFGHGRHYTFENDTGPDDANHAQHGLCVINGPGVRAERRDDLHLLDVAPTILRLFGMPAPDGTRGRVVGVEA